MRDKKLIPYLVGVQKLSQTDAEKHADDFRRELAKDDKKSNLTSVGLYFGDEELFSLLDAFRSGDRKWKEKGSRKSTDVCLFGRMLAEAADLNVDAAAQVAHAISTHKLRQEMDYWTAADDLKDLAGGEDAGAGMLGTAEFNASMFYRYACINLDQLGRNLGEKGEKGEWPNGSVLTAKTVNAFLLACYDAIPTGKLNGHAHFNPPSFALAVVRRRGMPLNLCNAFLNPVRAQGENGLGTASAEKLLEHLAHTRCMSPIDDASHYYAHDLGVDPRASAIKTLRKSLEELQKDRQDTKAQKGADDPRVTRLSRRIGKLDDVQEVDGYSLIAQKVMEELKK
jgi:hypothetical protein